MNLKNNKRDLFPFFDHTELRRHAGYLHLMRAEEARRSCDRDATTRIFRRSDHS